MQSFVETSQPFIQFLILVLVLVKAAFDVRKKYKEWKSEGMPKGKM